jgi:hypothetical protein
VAQLVKQSQHPVTEMAATYLLFLNNDEQVRILFRHCLKHKNTELSI